MEQKPAKRIDKFEDLDVWEKSMALTKEAYIETKK
jgi:hypothetical protein